MKNTMFALILTATCHIGMSQNADGKYYYASNDNDELTFIAASSPNKDTLWLSDDGVGEMIAWVWRLPANREDRPVIIFSSAETILQMRENPRYSGKK